MNLTLIRNIVRNSAALCYRSQNTSHVCVASVAKKTIHTTNSNQDLMEFFDTKKNWSEQTVKVGRAWKLDELRIKSNTDLHKLWYVLLKERNMLFTMEQECNEKMRLFPNPERIDKVQESMENIEKVIRERNVAYYKLETGETGERPVEKIVNLLGLPEEYRKQEHYLPKFMNTRWVKNYFEHGLVTSYAVKKFLRLYREKQRVEAKKGRNRDFNHVQHLLKRFPNMDMEAVKEQYPDVDLEKAKRSRKARGHFDPKY